MTNRLPISPVDGIHQLPWWLIHPTGKRLTPPAHLCLPDWPGRHQGVVLVRLERRDASVDATGRRSEEHS